MNEKTDDEGKVRVAIVSSVARHAGFAADPAVLEQKLNNHSGFVTREEIDPIVFH